MIAKVAEIGDEYSFDQFGVVYHQGWSVQDEQSEVWCFVCFVEVFEQFS